MITASQTKVPLPTALRHIFCQLLLAGVVCLPLVSCQATQTQLPKPQLEESVTPTPTAASQPSPNPTGEVRASSSGSSLLMVSFTDIANIPQAKTIQELGQLGVFGDLPTGEFQPNQPITRAEFVRWLVLAQNAIVKGSVGSYENPEGSMVRLAESGTATFPDVPVAHTDFKYIQGLLNTGFATGYQERYFRPDQFLTREEMAAIKVGVDYGQDLVNTQRQVKQDSRPQSAQLAALGAIWGWSDYAKISPGYIPHLNSESRNPAQCLKRTYGRTLRFEPKTRVTRAEAAICLSQVMVNGVERSSSQAVTRLTQAKP